MRPELIADYYCRTGENPLWHPHEKRLYWTDIPSGLMFRYDPRSGEHEQFFDGAVVGGFTIQEDGALMLFMAGGAVKRWQDGVISTIIGGIGGEGHSRFNDVIADPRGRVFAGTMPTPERLGRLYRIDPDGSHHVMAEDVGCANGMGFNIDRTQMFFTDSALRKIYIFDYDEATGNLSNRRHFLETPEGEGVPDGMTVDNEGDVWSARWDGGCLVHYGMDGQEKRRVAFPARKVSSVTFGGDDLLDMYVTTAGGDDKQTNGEGAGALFRLRAEVKGEPEYFSRIGM